MRCNGGDGNSGDGTATATATAATAVAMAAMAATTAIAAIVAKSAQMDIDWGNSGAAAPFKTLDAANLELDVSNAGIGSKHRIQVDPQDVDIKSLHTRSVDHGREFGNDLVRHYATSRRSDSQFRLVRGF